MGDHQGGTKQEPGDRKWDGKLLSLFEIAKLLAGRPKIYTRVKSASRAAWLKPGTRINPAEPEIGQEFRFEQINHKPIAQLTMGDVTSFKTITAMLGDTALTINTGQTDFEAFGNIDFCFFKWVLAGQVNLGRGGGGIAASKPKHFIDHRLYTEGFITFDDWISYLSTQTHRKALGQVWDGFGEAEAEVRFDRAQQTKTYTYRSDGGERNVTRRIRDEVFWAKDVFQGAALTLIQHMRLANPSGGFVAHAVAGDFNALVARFVGTIWQLIEVKLPGSLEYYDYKISKSQATGQTPFTDTRKYPRGRFTP